MARVFVASAAWRAWVAELFAPCEWEDVVEKQADQVTASGGDVVVVAFVSP